MRIVMFQLTGSIIYHCFFENRETKMLAGAVKLMPNPDRHYPYVLFAALLPWIYFASSVSSGASSVSDRRDLLTKVRFPAQVLPATVVVTNLMNFLLSVPILLVLSSLYRHWPSWHLVFAVPVLLVQTLFTLAVVYVLSALNVTFRDLQHIVANVMQMAFFLIPPFIFPIHIGALYAFYLFMYLANSFGHLGYEFYPRGLYHWPVTRWFNAATHHSMHHTEKVANFGIYYLHWDLWCGTLHKRYFDRYHAIKKKELPSKLPGSRARTPGTRRPRRRRGSCPAPNGWRG